MAMLPCGWVVTCMLVVPAAAAQTPASSGPGPRLIEAHAESSREAGRHDAKGSLHRTAAAIDESLDVYRLAAVELGVALAQIEDAGHSPHAAPDSPVPEPAAQAFKRLASSVGQRISADALTALPRAYHVDAIDALEALAAAQSIGHIRDPARRLLAAWQHQAELAAAIVDIFSRQRPLVTEVVGFEATLDGINDALSQLSFAETNIATVRARSGTPGEQLQGFLRLEIALGRALDLIAAAEESGLHLGFEMSRATVGLAGHLQQMQVHLVQMEAVVRAMERPPAAVGSDLWAVVESAVTNVGHPATKQVVLTWTPPVPGPLAPALLRIYAPKESTDAAALRPLPPEAELPSGRGTFTLPLDTLPETPGSYQVVSVSPFGVERKGPVVVAHMLPAVLAPPGQIQAILATVPPDSAFYYHEAGAVTVHWQRSASDTAGQLRLKAYAATHTLPQVAHYALYRHTGGGAETKLLGTVAQGVTTWVDRPSLTALAAGVHYAVVAVDAQGQHADAPGPDDQNAFVRRDLAAELALASAGAAKVVRPTSYERRMMQQFDAAPAFASAQATFGRRNAAERHRLLQQFWTGVAPNRRLAWHATWLQRMAPAERRSLLAHAPLPAFHRDASWTAAGIWVQQNIAFASEPERFFALLTPSAQAAAQRAWETGLGLETLAAVRGAQADATDDFNWATPVQQHVWYASRDPEEQQRLDEAFTALPVQKQQAAADAWFFTLPAALRQAVVWPPWESLTTDERDAFMQGLFDRADAVGLPNTLWPEFLAWLAWQEADDAVKMQQIAADVGQAAHNLCRLRYALRPLDIAVGFKLPLYATLLTIGLLAILLLHLAHQRPCKSS